jgi:hypothetical protein
VAATHPFVVPAQAETRGSAGAKADRWKRSRYAAVPVADISRVMPLFRLPWQQAKDKLSQSVDQLSLKISDA